MQADEGLGPRREQSGFLDGLEVGCKGKEEESRITLRPRASTKGKILPRPRQASTGERRAFVFWWRGCGQRGLGLPGLRCLSEVRVDRSSGQRLQRLKSEREKPDAISTGLVGRATGADGRTGLRAPRRRRRAGGGRARQRRPAAEAARPPARLPGGRNRNSTNGHFLLLPQPSEGAQACGCHLYCIARPL